MTPKEHLEAMSNPDRLKLIADAMNEWAAISSWDSWSIHAAHRALGLLFEALQNDLPKLKDDKP